MSRLPPCPAPTDPLSPYRTLFRSYRSECVCCSLVEKSAPFMGLSFLPVGFSADDRQAFVLKSPGGGAQSLWRIDPMTGEGKEVSRNGTVDASRLLWSSRSEEHTSELQSLMRISYAVFCLKKQKKRLARLTRDKT